MVLDGRPAPWRQWGGSGGGGWFPSISPCPALSCPAALPLLLSRRLFFASELEKSSLSSSNGQIGYDSVSQEARMVIIISCLGPIVAWEEKEPPT